MTDKKETSIIDDLCSEINYLKKKAELADEMLKYYDKETMNFNIPEKWKNLNRMNADQLDRMPKSPRHALNEKISELLPYSENGDYVNWDRVSETALD